MRQKTTLNRNFVWAVRGVVLLLFILFLWSLGRNLIGLSQLDERLLLAREETAILRQENQELQVMAQQVESPYHEEKEIRNKLGLTKPGETVVLIPEAVWETTQEASDSSTVIVSTFVPIWKKWLYLFL